MKLLILQKKFGSCGLNIFSAQELKRASGMTKNAVRLWLIRHIKNGTIIPLKKRRGIYCFADGVPHDWLIANKLYQPSYVSLETALSYYDVLPESVYSVTSVTTKITRAFQALDKEFLFQKIKKTAYCGYIPQEINGQTALIAEKEKALADYLYFVFLKKKELNSRLRFRSINKKVFKSYLEKFQIPKFIKWGEDVIRKGS